MVRITDWNYKDVVEKAPPEDVFVIIMWVLLAVLRYHLLWGKVDLRGVADALAGTAT